MTHHMKIDRQHIKLAVPFLLRNMGFHSHVNGDLVTVYMNSENPSFSNATYQIKPKMFKIAGAEL